MKNYRESFDKELDKILHDNKLSFPPLKTMKDFFDYRDKLDGERKMRDLKNLRFRDN